MCCCTRWCVLLRCVVFCCYALCYAMHHCVLVCDLMFWFVTLWCVVCCCVALYAVAFCCVFCCMLYCVVFCFVISSPVVFLVCAFFLCLLCFSVALLCRVVLRCVVSMLYLLLYDSDIAYSFSWHINIANIWYVHVIQAHITGYKTQTFTSSYFSKVMSSILFVCL